jgi:hypothetical protein
MVTTDVLSPDLVLVSDELRAEALAALPVYPWERESSEPQTQADPLPAPRERPLASKIALYLAWQLLVGLLTGLGIVISIALPVLALSLIAG